MKKHRDPRTQQENKTASLEAFVRGLGIDLVGIADLSSLQDLPVGLSSASSNLFEQYRFAIVLGSQLNKLGKNTSAVDANLYLERAALEVLAYLEEKGSPALIIHPEDEFDPIGCKLCLIICPWTKQDPDGQ